MTHADGYRIPDPAPPILVVQMAQGFLTHSALAIARSAGRLGIPVYGLYAGTRAAEARSRYWSGQFRHPGERASTEQWLQELLQIGARLGRAIMITTDDAATVLAAEQGAALRERFVYPEQPSALVHALAHKGEMHRRCEELRIPVPRAAFPTSEHEVRTAAAAIGFPVVAKRIAAWLPTRLPDAPSVAITQSLDELLDAYRAMECPDEPNVMIQEYIPGGDDAQWIHNGYFDAQSECLVGFTGRKLRQRGPHTGPATLGECVDKPAVHDQTLRLAKSLSYRGILDIGFRYDARDGAYKLLDANPRIGSSFRMFVGTNGMDVLRAAYLDLAGAAVPATTPREGRWLVEPLDLSVSVKLWRRRELRLREWLRSLRGIDELTWFARDDLRPAAAMATQCVAYAIEHRPRQRVR